MSYLLRTEVNALKMAEEGPVRTGLRTQRRYRQVDERIVRRLVTAGLLTDEGVLTTEGRDLLWTVDQLRTASARL